MELKNQVVSLELAKRLKELGVKQESCFVWHERLENKWDVKFNRGDTSSNYCYPAFSVAELGEMLPISFFTCKSLPSNQWVVCDQLEHGFPPGFGGFEASATTEADARAKMMVYLLELGLITT